MNPTKIISNFAEVFFSLEKTQYDKIKYINACVYLDKLIELVGDSYQHKIRPEEQLTIISDLLFQKEMFRNISDSTLFTLSGTLNHRGGSCLGLTTVFMVFIEYFSIPVKPLLSEGHIKLFCNDIKIPFIFEVVPTYCTLQTITHQSCFDKHEKILTLNEFLAVHLSNHATHFYARAGLMDDAVFLIDSALEIFPAYTAGWINRAVIMKQMDHFKEMNRSLEIAKSLKPGWRYSQAIERIENNTASTESVT
jgi:tetratricopeptide (TPR) repeat protein